VGLFVTLLVGAYTIEDLWDKFGDLRMPVVRAALSIISSKTKVPSRKRTSIIGLLVVSA